ncbi:MAG TPA: 3-hydroxyacyl-CoA dehydrogenase NAD-binding domain-containing protein, partial [Nocardioides sp.]|nr:3-hydroxyacyl-CoA dehydrogenase NAD-binding domain-containing protein [Nocardioides sp.]
MTLSNEQIHDTLVLPYLQHALRMHSAGYASAVDIDNGMRFGCGYPKGPMTVAQERGLFTPADEDGDAAAPEFKIEINSVGVVGTGTMATGMIQVFAQAGYDVVFVGRGQDKIDGVIASITKGLDKLIEKGKLDEDGKSNVLGRLTFSTEREALAGVDIVVEAIAERLSDKVALFEKLDRIARDDAILATNTSSLPIIEIARATRRPEAVVGTHFFNPPPVMKLLELVRSVATSEETMAQAKAFGEQLGKRIIVAQDRGGFIVNLLLIPFLTHAVRVYESGFATREDIDEGMRLGCGHPMGPLQLLDYIGLDTALFVCEALYEEYANADYAPP